MDEGDLWEGDARLETKINEYIYNTINSLVGTSVNLELNRVDMKQQLAEHFFISSKSKSSDVLEKSVMKQFASCLVVGVAVDEGRPTVPNFALSPVRQTIRLITQIFGRLLFRGVQGS